MTSVRSLVIASRESKLAMVQSEMIRDRLMGLHPGLTVSILGMTTQGDQILDRPLAQIGGKGLFIKELEVALQDGRADLAVHSMKDMPAVLPPGFELVVVGDREAPQDAFVSNKFNTLAELPKGARVGTSSLRRECQLRLKYPHLTIHSLRGNVGTRLSKLDADQYDAIILAAAGLRRLGLGDRIRSVLTLEESLPAIGQGALAIEYRSGREDVAAVLAPLTAADTTAIVTAERALGAELLGSCDVPLAGHARILSEGGQRQLLLEGFIGLPDGSTHLRDQVKGDPADARALGKALGQKLLANGAQAILDQLAHHKK